MIRDDVLGRIRQHERTRPRSLQTEIGPSELANPCDHCVAAQLAGWQRLEYGDRWLPYIGVAVHAQLADAFTGLPGWLVEHRVTVGEIDGRPVHGTADLFDVDRGVVVDFKVVGASTLNEAARHGASAQYRGQVQLYAHGFARAGHHVNGTAILYLPRNSPNLGEAVIVERPYEPAVADAILERAQRLVDVMAPYGRISERTRDVFIDALPRAAGCYRCAEFPRIIDQPAPTVAELFHTERAS